MVWATKITGTFPGYITMKFSIRLFGFVNGVAVMALTLNVAKPVDFAREVLQKKMKNHLFGMFSPRSYKKMKN